MDDSLYQQHAELERDQWWFVSRRAILDAVLTKWLPAASDRQILDVGCGTGGMLPMLARFGSVRGMEAEEQAVERCHGTFGSFDVRRGDIPTDVPSDGSFDVVTAFDVIEHIDDDVRALDALRAAVRPGGTVVVTVPALQWLWSDHDVLNGHKRRYTRPRLIDLVRCCDLELEHVSYFNTLLLPLVAGARLAQRVSRSGAEPRSDLTRPSPMVNRLLTRVMSSERALVPGRGLPVGVSLVAVARRRG